MDRAYSKLAFGLCIALAVLVPWGGAIAGQLHTLHAFNNDSIGIGDMPQTGLIQDMAGNFYGTTMGYGPRGHGTVFKIAPNGVETILYSFNEQSGGFFPEGRLLLDAAGNLYGTTYRGGIWAGNCSNGGCGTAFKLAPDGTETVLHAFTGSLNDGGGPIGGLIIDKAGNLYGTASFGGSGGCYRTGGCCPGAVLGCGVVFKLAPDGKETILHFFGNDGDGSFPCGELLADKEGNLYGATGYGGANGSGTIFKLALDGVETILHSFTGNDGAVPFGGLIFDKTGNLYGTTSYGGAKGSGVVFKLAPDGTETVLYTFVGGVDGSHPNGRLVADSAGNLYGTTFWGGNGGCFEHKGCGTIFKIMPDGTEEVLWRFAGDDGWELDSGVILDDAGFLYGTTPMGGAFDSGTLFKIKK